MSKVDLSKYMHFDDFNIGDRIRIDRDFFQIDEMGNKNEFKDKTGTITDRIPDWVGIEFDDEDIFYQWEDGRKDYEIWFMVDEIEYEDEEK